METKRVATLITFIFFLVAGFFLYFFIYSKQPSIQGQVVNGRDEHGCIEGYSWNETILACINYENGTHYQVFDFQSCSDAGYAIDENNLTGYLQCHSLNGTIFTQNSTNVSKTNNTTTNYPNNILIYGNFTINSSGSANNTTASNPYQNITINLSNLSH